MNPDVVVIGGGLHGCSTAVHCARAGLSVVVLEREAVGRHASGVNAGGVRQLGRHLAEVPLSALAMTMWQQIGDYVDDDCGFQQSGQIQIASTDAHMAKFRDRVDQLQKMGFSHEEVINSEELYRLVPAAVKGLCGGLISRQDGFANPYRTTSAFRRKAQRSGVVFHENCPVVGLRRENTGFRIKTADGIFDCGIVVNCAGAWAGAICDWMGEPVPLRATAPMMTITAPMPQFVKPVVGYAGAPLSFKQFSNGTVMVGGGYSGVADLETGLSKLRYDLLSGNLRTAIRLFPIMKQAHIIRQWAGIEGEMIDLIPVIGPSSTTEGLYHAFGFSSHGFQLGPAVGLLICDLIQHGKSRLDLSDFAITRFRKQTLH